MKVNKQLLNIRTAISLMEFYIEQEKISQYEGKFILEQLEIAKGEIEMEITEAFEEVFVKTMDELEINKWLTLAESEHFETVRERCAELDNYDSELFDAWESEMMWDI